MTFDPDDRNDIQRLYNQRVTQQALDYERSYHRSLEDSRASARVNMLSAALKNMLECGVDVWGHGSIATRQRRACCPCSCHW